MAATRNHTQDAPPAGGGVLAAGVAAAVVAAGADGAEVQRAAQNAVAGLLEALAAEADEEDAGGAGTGEP